MKKILPPKLEAGRVTEGPMRSSASWGVYGAFFVWGPSGARLKIISSGADYPEAKGWEHVSVSCERRCPNWQEMCFVKDLFWDKDECVIQFHPPESEYINEHPYCLHLWKLTTTPQPMPPSTMVGIKGAKRPRNAEEAYAIQIERDVDWHPEDRE